MRCDKVHVNELDRGSKIYRIEAPNFTGLTVHKYNINPFAFVLHWHAKKRYDGCSTNHAKTNDRVSVFLRINVVKTGREFTTLTSNILLQREQFWNLNHMWAKDDDMWAKDDDWTIDFKFQKKDSLCSAGWRLEKSIFPIVILPNKASLHTTSCFQWSATQHAYLDLDKIKSFCALTFATLK